MNAIVRSAANVAAVLLLVPACAGAAHSASWDENGLNYYFATTKDTFVMYEYVPLTYIVTNTSNDTLAIQHPCEGLGDICFIVWAPPTPWHPDPYVIWSRCACYDVVWIDPEFAPGETYVREEAWGMENPYHNTLIWRPGIYQLDGRFGARIFPSYEHIGHDFSLEITILSGAAGAPEPVGSWGAIKALYR